MTVFVWALGAMGCAFQEAQPVTTEVVVQAEEPVAEEVEAEAEAEPRVPMSGDPIADGGAKPVDPKDWNPISVPQGPRENGGVRWEGVKASPDETLPTYDELVKKYGAEAVGNPDRPWNRDTVRDIINKATQ